MFHQTLEIIEQIGNMGPKLCIAIDNNCCAIRRDYASISHARFADIAFMAVEGMTSIQRLV